MENCGRKALHARPKEMAERIQMKGGLPEAAESPLLEQGQDVQHGRLGKWLGLSFNVGVACDLGNENKKHYRQA